MKPKCVFCGKPPQDKNKEHVFPQWLLKMTGFDKKQASVGTNWITGKEIVFSATKYTFPSCTKCNSDFGVIEGQVKIIVEKLQIDEDVTGDELELLLDWFDKIRISAWLGVKYMNKDVFTMDPKYYINSRLALKDRVLSITNTYKKEKALNWSGVNTPAFMLSPTAFTLRINNLVLVNCSSDFVVSKQLGFPYVWKHRPSQDLDAKETDMFLLKGKEKSNFQLFKTRLYTPSITVSQPMFKASKDKLPEYYDNNYIRNNAYDYDSGIGKIFISKNNQISTIERDDAINFSMPGAKSIYGKVEVVRPILELQIELIKKRKIDMSKLSDKQKKDEIEGKNKTISYLRDQIRTYNY